MKNHRFVVTVGTDAVTVRTRGSRHVRTANILGREADRDGFEYIWLDRRVLDADEKLDPEQEWTASGAVSTVLSRPVNPLNH